AAVALSILINALAARIFTLSFPQTSLISLLSLGLIIPLHARKCERDANIAAERLLCSIDKKEIVNKHITTLSKQRDTCSLWFDSPAQQKMLLERAIATTNTP